MNSALPVAVDVVIPVYNAVDDLARCVESVLGHTPASCRIVLIDDASPDPAVAAFFAELAARKLPNVTLLRNEANLGFTLTANRGMGLSRCDVVLLNSDTVVTAGWLEALARCAASDPAIGTVTPFSNNAEICSYPRFCEGNPWVGHDHIEFERASLASAGVPTYPDIPTGVGFCLYIRRALLDAVGAFDPAFGAGYGEENDLCMRAAASGYRNVLCDDAFVAHIGGRSFEDRKGELGAQNMQVLLARHPAYLDIVRGYIAADPLRPIRAAALARARVIAQPGRGVLHVVHGDGGGTEHHVRALIGASPPGYRHYLAVAVRDNWHIEEHHDDGAVCPFRFRHEAGEPWPDFIAGLCEAFGIGLVHLHNISGCREGLIEAMAALPVPYGYTVHDLNFACPTITFTPAGGLYCGAQTDRAVCSRCLAQHPTFSGVDIAGWRDGHARLLEGAAFIIAPSRWAADTLRRYFPNLDIEVIAHGAAGVWAAKDTRKPVDSHGGRPARLAALMPDDDVPAVAVLGAVGPDKGSRRVERMVELARARGSRVRFVLIGYTDVQWDPWQSEDAVFTVHGRYEARDLPEFLAHYRVRLVAYPSAGPETFSFTLSEALAAGKPVIVPPFGALAERVQGTGAGWIWSDEEWRDEARMLSRIEALLAPEHEAALADASRCALRREQQTLAGMVQSTLRVYDRVSSAASTRTSAGEMRPLARARIRDALGYEPWTPPPVITSALCVETPPIAETPSNAEVTAAASGADAHGRLAQFVVRARHTVAGRLLHRLTPASILDALRTRLF